ncbi:glutamyl aminopeptidase isoform X1 [Maniola hyperantus]|uniref:glutamyl aminopeptidase isoform X1 n=1 Tax=Aphantopus hyperantus TaxID=2795564 RepID=UPI001569161B|nr:glutamyl aminopeptidase isoform X1 [Maniola hyperantus]
MIPQIMRWVCNNKLLVFFGVATFCFLVSTVALSTQNNALKRSMILIKQKPIQQDLNGANQAESAESNRYRLPTHVRPTNYALRLNPNLSKKVFEGEVKISLNISKPVKSIFLHANNLDIHYTEVKSINNQSIPVISTAMLSTSEVFQVNLKEEIQANTNCELILTFTGRLDKGIVGFYASTMRSGDTMVASKFQPTYARQAFPCFDEPDFKATYDITLVKPVDYMALSNMNELSKTLDPTSNTEAVTFATSVPMSTYLACFVVCNFNAKENEIMANGIGNNFKLRSFAQKDQTHKIDFAQDIGKRVTEFYIRYYEVPFPLPKLDMIAIPDYVSGATEHWGLITYRETSFLIDNETASSKNKISVANTVAHELAHMWFGNLVTMKWWDEVWLNEGFASYMQVKSLNAIEPSWTMLDQFLTRTLHSVLVTDAKLSSHPIVQTVETPDQITAIFDAISYNKGASVLRMLEGFIGEENFRRGVSDYLKKYEFGNTITQDLLSSMEPYFKKDYPNLSLSYIMDTWTRQMGYPLLSVKPGDQANTYIVTQTRFLINPEAVDNQTSEFRYRWYIPITYKTNKGSKEGITWFPNSQESVTITLGEGEKWLKINNNQVGYYRVDYTADMWENLIQELKNGPEQLTISDRAHLLNDIFALAESKMVPYAVALDLSTYLNVESDFVPWETATSIFATLSERLTNTPAHDNLEKYVQGLVKPFYEKQTWEKTSLSVIEGLLRARVLSLATSYRLPAAEAKVRSLFLSWLNADSNQTRIEPDLRDFVYYYGMKSATQDEWDKLWQIYLKEEDVQEQSKLRSALSAPRDTNVLRRYLDLAWDESNIRSQDYLNVLSSISANPNGTDLVWDNVRANWPKLVERFTLNSRYLGSLIPSITDSFNTDQRLKEMEEFFARYPEAGAGESSRERALETVRNNIQWVTTHLSVVSTWLEEAVNPPNL